MHLLNSKAHEDINYLRSKLSLIENNLLLKNKNRFLTGPIDTNYLGSNLFNKSILIILRLKDSLLSKSKRLIIKVSSLINFRK